MADGFLPLCKRDTRKVRIGDRLGLAFLRDTVADEIGVEGDEVEPGFPEWLCLRALQTSPVRLTNAEDADAYLATLAAELPLRAREIAVNAFVARYEAT